MTGSCEEAGRLGRAEVLDVERRRRWTVEQKVRIVEGAYVPGNSVSLVARRHGVAGDQLFTWRRLMAQGTLTTAGETDKPAAPPPPAEAHVLAPDGRRQAPHVFFPRAHTATLRLCDVAYRTYTASQLRV